MSPASVLLENRMDGLTISLVRYAPHQRIPPHAHDQDGISVVLQGCAVEEAELRSTVAQAGWSAARPYGLRHSNRFGPEGAVVLAVVPDAKAFEGLPRRWRWCDSPVAYRAAMRLLRNDEDALTELMAELVEERSCRREAYLAERARRLLEDCPARPSVLALARHFAVHPVYLARKFRQSFGVSIREYWTVRMVQRACEAVVSTTQPLSRIAHECGFADHSHMCRAFRVVTGANPARMRKAASP